MGVAARDENIFSIDLTRDRKPLPELGDMFSNQCDEIETNDRDPAFPVVGKEDPTPKRPLHSLTARRAGHADHRQPRFWRDIGPTTSNPRHARFLTCLRSLSHR